jgi:hypothetical protein
MVCRLSNSQYEEAKTILDEMTEEEIKYMTLSEESKKLLDILEKYSGKTYYTPE